MNFLELAEKYQLVTFLSLVRVAGLEEAFGDFGDYTLFVPDENAFLGTAGGIERAGYASASVGPSVTPVAILGLRVSTLTCVHSPDTKNMA